VLGDNEPITATGDGALDAGRLAGADAERALGSAAGLPTARPMVAPRPTAAAAGEFGLP
jgi:hypothetical protein